jgi:hypothetical protein
MRRSEPDSQQRTVAERPVEGLLFGSRARETFRVSLFIGVQNLRGSFGTPFLLSESSDVEPVWRLPLIAPLHRPVNVAF